MQSAVIYKGYRFHGKELPLPPTYPIRADRKGQIFGRLTVVEDLGVAGKGHRWWGCLCECGQRPAVRSRELDRGHTQSCGCLRDETRKGRAGHNRLPFGHASRNELLASYKKSARDRGHEWLLVDALFFDIVTSKCHYCGVPPDRVRKPNKGVNGEFIYTGIDRIDNSMGYIAGNVVPCCWDCNRAKGTLHLVDFEAWLDRIAAARGARFEHGESGARR